MKPGKSTASENLMQLFVGAGQAFRADIEAHLDSAPTVPRALRELNGGQRRLLTLIPAGGARGTDLAESASMSKQALGQLAAGLEAAGLVRAEPDPLDGRARIWRLTAAGTRAADAARETLRAVEAQWRAHLGPRDYERLTGILRRVLDERSN